MNQIVFCFKECVQYSIQNNLKHREQILDLIERIEKLDQDPLFDQKIEVLKIDHPHQTSSGEFFFRLQHSYFDRSAVLERLKTQAHPSRMPKPEIIPALNQPNQDEQTPNAQKYVNSKTILSLKKSDKTQGIANRNANRNIELIEKMYNFKIKMFPLSA
ncbi:MAG: hypothetical protein HWD61_00295 [Parachlamydiaceae bacterium]|nr:MAG: hypothetical protein HWD61_00295 [Parachlamydiaceae bacterium]